jgi:glycosyltransferase involved in cell wall biosynthesis
MKNKLSLLMITKNGQELIEKSLTSVIGLVDEIAIIDNYSSDRTVTIAKKFGARIYFNREENLGKQRRFGLDKVSNDWVLVLDSDEIVSEKLAKEIKLKIVYSENYGYYIPFQNHFLGRPLRYGGENYKKLILFRKKSVKIHPSMVHEKFELKQGRAGYLKNKIYHYSYRSLWQMFRKFSDYAIREAKQKSKDGEKSSFKKIFLYPPHLFWARFIKDKGYKDGIFRIPLDLGFAYMEFLTYFLLFFYSVYPKGVRG